MNTNYQIDFRVTYGELKSDKTTTVEFPISREDFLKQIETIKQPNGYIVRVDYDTDFLTKDVEQLSFEDLNSLAAAWKASADKDAFYTKFFIAVDLVDGPDKMPEVLEIINSSRLHVVRDCLNLKEAGSVIHRELYEDSDEWTGLPEKYRTYFDYESYAKDLRSNGTLYHFSPFNCWIYDTQG